MYESYAPATIRLRAYRDLFGWMGAAFDPQLKNGIAPYRRIFSNCAVGNPYGTHGLR